MAGPACKHTSAPTPIGAAVRFPKAKAQHPQAASHGKLRMRRLGRKNPSMHSLPWRMCVRGV